MALRSVGARPEGGYTLVEVMVALVILTIGIAGVTSGLTTVTFANVHANEQARATSLAVQKLEELKALPASELVSEGAMSVTAEGIEGSGPYRRKVEVVRSTVGLKVAEVTVDVEYPAGRLGRRHVQLFTLVYTGG